MNRQGECSGIFRQIFARSELAHLLISRQLVNAKACARACTNSNSTVCATVASGEIINAVPLRCYNGVLHNAKRFLIRQDIFSLLRS